MFKRYFLKLDNDKEDTLKYVHELSVNSFILRGFIK